MLPLFTQVLKFTLDSTFSLLCSPSAGWPTLFHNQNSSSSPGLHFSPGLLAYAYSGSWLLTAHSFLVGSCHVSPSCSELSANAVEDLWYYAVFSSYLSALSLQWGSCGLVSVPQIYQACLLGHLLFLSGMFFTQISTGLVPFITEVSLWPLPP